MPRFEQGEIRITASIQGQILDLLLLHNAADVGCLRLE